MVITALFPVMKYYQVSNSSFQKYDVISVVVYTQYSKHGPIDQR